VKFKAVSLISWSCFAACALMFTQAGNAAEVKMGLEGIPSYDHIILIEMENRQYGQIIGASPATSPHMTELSESYNSATNYYGITHVSQPNYVALTSGDQQGLVDDDPWYCRSDGSKLSREQAVVAGAPNPGDMNPSCSGAAHPHYPNHHFDVPNLFDQMNTAHISWSMFNQSMPIDAVTHLPRPEDPTYPTKSMSPGLYNLYVSKHNPSVNYDKIRASRDFYSHNKTADEFFSELKSGAIPRFSYVVPDQCHDDHGPGGDLKKAPECVQTAEASPLLKTGDDYVYKLVTAIKSSPLWTSKENVAVVITFDEDDYGSAGIQGCCGYQPAGPNAPRVGSINQGGGHIPMIVITNHGVRSVQDPTPYNHYSLLRTIEDSFGIANHLAHAALKKPVQPADGSFLQTAVLPMAPMFAIKNGSKVN
jgi:hypothetical protein